MAETMAETASSIVARLRERGYRVTSQRVVIVEEVMQAEGHVTVPALARRVQERLPEVDVSTVYRTLQLLEELDIVRHSHQESGAEYHRVGEGDHVHLACSKCGSQDDLPSPLAEQLKDLVVKHHGFVPDLTHFAIAGLCVACQQPLAPPRGED